MTTTTKKKTKPTPRGGPSVRLFRAMSAAGLEVSNLYSDLTEQYPSVLNPRDLVDALEVANSVPVRLDRTQSREDQHGDAQDLKDALEDAIAEVSMLASEARSIEKRLERVLAQVRKHDTFKLPKERK